MKNSQKVSKTQNDALEEELLKIYKTLEEYFHEALEAMRTLDKIRLHLSSIFKHLVAIGEKFDWWSSDGKEFVDKYQNTPLKHWKFPDVIIDFAFITTHLLSSLKHENTEEDE